MIASQNVDLSSWITVCIFLQGLKKTTKNHDKPKLKPESDVGAGTAVLQPSIFK
jgi:hypothetical protein